VCKAKESFLERLKREREEAQRPHQPAPSIETYEHVEEEEESSYHYQPLPTIQKEVSSEESSTDEEEIPSQTTYRTVQKPTNGFNVIFSFLY
jgi:hypothetical protein